MTTLGSVKYKYPLGPLPFITIVMPDRTGEMLATIVTKTVQGISQLLEGEVVVAPQPP